MERIWRWFERLVPPFPAQDRGVPPKGLVRFILFYTQGLWKFLIIIALLTAFMAIGEALFFSCMGLIVDWTTSTLPSFFIEDHGKKLVLMLLLAGVFLPLATVIHSLILHQTVSGNYPMQIRWQIHRYMLGQSLSFFTDEFAGRVANKVMQTAMAVRTSVLKLIDVLVHLCVYFATMLWMLGDADLVLMLPLIVWFILYSLALGIFIPNLRKQAQVQADTRSDMVGRVVDSYVNIATVKLFGGKGREAKYAKAGMEGFIKAEYKALRILTLLDVSVQFLNYALLISITVLSLWLWIHYAITPGSIAIAVAVARACQEAQGQCKNVHVRMSGNIFKNARGVGIPGTNEYGIYFAIALAIVCGDWSKGLEVFSNVNDDAVQAAHALLQEIPINSAM